MVKIAMYKGRKRVFNRLVSWWTRGPYSHTELVIDGVCYSSSFLDKGVRKKAIELDPENTDYYSSYGSFCISIGKFEEAEGAYSEAAEMDESNASRYLAEFAVDYYNAVLARYGEIMDDPAARAPYAKKALLFMLKALEIEPEEAKKLL